jgi:hypothetical protein
MAGCVAEGEDESTRDQASGQSQNFGATLHFFEMIFPWANEGKKSEDMPLAGPYGAMPAESVEGDTRIEGGISTTLHRKQKIKSLRSSFTKPRRQFQRNSTRSEAALSGEG